MSLLAVAMQAELPRLRVAVTIEPGVAKEEAVVARRWMRPLAMATAEEVRVPQGQAPQAAHHCFRRQENRDPREDRRWACTGALHNALGLDAEVLAGARQPGPKDTQ